MDLSIFQIQFATVCGTFILSCNENAVLAIQKDTSDLQTKTKKPQNPNNHPKLADYAISQIQNYLTGKQKTFDFPILPQGTDFQKTVWKALIQIPYGETRNYKDIATTIGKPNACRAVGAANHNNPLPFIIPCHRVVGSNGEPIGYALGLQLQIFLLQMESSVKTYMS